MLNIGIAQNCPLSLRTVRHVFARNRKIARTYHYISHVCLSVRKPVWYNRALTGQIFTTFDILALSDKICRENSSYIKV